MQWTESVDVERPLALVREAVLDQEQLMQWSAWPEATGFTCAVEGDGRSPGSQVVFRDRRGTVQGRQTIIGADGTVVRNRLANRGPLGREITPEVDFRLEALGPQRTRVHLDFRGRAPLPAPLRQLVEVPLGRWVRRLHVKDLAQLEAHVGQQPVSR